MKRTCTQGWWLAIAALALMTALAAAADPARAFQAELDALRAAYGFPGATAAYVLPNGAFGTATTGWADVEQGLPMTTDSRMLSASIGKTYLGALAVTLAAAGSLDLDRPVGLWLNDRSWFTRLPHYEHITLRHLLNHTSGLRDHVYEERFAADVAHRWREPDQAFPPEKLIEYILDQPALFAPGAAWAYTDTGYILAGLVIEEAAGHSCYDEITRRFIAPLGLTKTSPSDRRDLSGLAAGYVDVGNRLGLPVKTTDDDGVLVWHPGMEGMGGGWVSTSLDLARWGHALLMGDALTVRAQNDLLRTVPVDHASEFVHYGAGVAVRRSGPHGPSYGHGGWIPGYCSSLRHYADHGVTIAFQINTDAGIADHRTDVIDAAERRLAAVVFAHLQGNSHE